MCKTGTCKCPEYGSMVLRLVVGVIFFAHGGQKLFGWFGGPGIDGTTGFLAGLGFAGAGFWAWVLALVEFFGGIFVFFGFLTTAVAILLSIDMIVAFFVVHFKNGFFMQTGGIEMVLLLFAATFSFIATGGGIFSLDKVWCRKWHCKGGKCLPMVHHGGAGEIDI